MKRVVQKVERSLQKHRWLEGIVQCKWPFVESRVSKESEKITPKTVKDEDDPSSDPLLLSNLNCFGGRNILGFILWGKTGASGGEKCWRATGTEIPTRFGDLVSVCETEVNRNSRSVAFLKSKQ